MSSPHLDSPSVVSPLKALVLAGGKGTRLRPLTYTTAKQLVPVANKPILHYALESIAQAGIIDIGVIISPETGDKIKEAVHAWCPSHLRVTFISQEAPLGLAHAVQIAEPYLQKSPFLMYLGDNLIQGELLGLTQAFQAGNASAQILLKAVSNPEAFGIAELDSNDRVLHLVEKPKHPKSNLALVGVYLFTSEIFEAIQQIKPSARGELEITDAIQQLIESGKTVHATQIKGWWLDTGKKDDLLEANRIVLDSYCEVNVQGHLDSHSQIRGRVEVGKGSKIKNSILQGPVKIGQDCVIENAYIGPYTSIGDQCRVIQAEVENSVFLSQCELNNLSGRIEQSLVGSGCSITKAKGRPAATYRFLLSDHSAVETL